MADKHDEYKDNAIDNMAEAPIYILWLAGGSCDGCTMAMLGAATPKIEELLLG